MPNKLPIKLNKEPLLDAIFEVRFSMIPPASNILPGIFFSKLDGEKLIERLPAAELPKQMRDAEPNLQYAPVMRIRWKEFILLISDRSVAVACKMPYAGWAKFKNAIIKIVRIIDEVGILESIQRYSMKYIDLIPIKNLNEQIASVNINISLGNHKLEKEVFQFRIEITDGEFINAVQIVSSGVVKTQDNTTKEGLIIDIDTIRKVDSLNIKTFISEIEEILENIHHNNKVMFFKCITPTTLDLLEPVYV
jgi:uncharacterized protein (TIGR04255 family)